MPGAAAQEPRNWGASVPGLLFVLIVAVLLLRAHRVQRTWVISPASIAYPGIGMQHAAHSITQQLGHLVPTAPPGARILFIDDPFDESFYTLSQLCQLLYRDPSIVVERTKVIGSAPPYSSYDYVLKFEGRTLSKVYAVGTTRGAANAVPYQRQAAEGEELPGNMMAHPTPGT
jgi:hypothetical protein